MMMAVTTGGNGVIMEKILIIHMAMITINIPLIHTTMTGIK